MRLNLQMFGGRGASSGTASTSSNQPFGVSVNGRSYTGVANVSPDMVETNERGRETFALARDLAQQELGTTAKANKFDAEARGLDSIWGTSQWIRRDDGVLLGRVDVGISYTGGKPHIKVEARGFSDYTNPATGRSKKIKNPISDFSKSYAPTANGTKQAFKDAGKWYKNNK